MRGRGGRAWRRLPGRSIVCDPTLVVRRVIRPEATMASGAAKRDRAEDRRGAALEVALRTGLLKRCPTHGEVYDPGQHDYQGACMVATYLVNRADPLVASFQDDRVPLTDLLRSICKSYPTCCSECPPPVAWTGPSTSGTVGR